MRKILAVLLITLSTITFSAAQERELIIKSDPGGAVDEYVLDIIRSKDAGVNKVVIDGMCASACVLWLHSDFGLDVCATENARLGWHIPFYMYPDGSIIVSKEADTEMREFSDIVISGMPEELKQRWQTTPIPSPSNGDSSEDMNWVVGDEAVKMIGACDG